MSSRAEITPPETWVAMLVRPGSPPRLALPPRPALAIKSLSRAAHRKGGPKASASGTGRTLATAHPVHHFNAVRGCALKRTLAKAAVRAHYSSSQHSNEFI